jgi:AcrR family transcriptional regulator
MARPIEHLRADAARNVQRIVEVAARQLGADPGAGMAEVAVAAGVSRATVYRHFTTREALIHAIHAQAVEQSERALEDSRLGEDGATEALRRLVTAWLDVADRYAFAQLAAQPELSGTDAVRRRQRGALTAPLLALLERGQAAGEFTTTHPPAWLARVFGALLIAGARAIADGTLTREQAPDAVFETLVRGLRG